MNMAKLLKRSANLFMGITMFKLIAEDLAAEFRHDASLLAERSNSLVRRSPYRSAGAAAALGLAAGMAIASRQRHRQVP
jgi:ElaB/YqjD/DUF883 family membrane-anchored ribosome-binding protein